MTEAEKLMNDASNAASAAFGAQKARTDRMCGEIIEAITSGLGGIDSNRAFDSHDLLTHHVAAAATGLECAVATTVALAAARVIDASTQKGLPDNIEALQDTINEAISLGIKRGLESATVAFAGANTTSAAVALHMTPEEQAAFLAMLDEGDDSGAFKLVEKVAKRAGH